MRPITRDPIAEARERGAFWNGMTIAMIGTNALWLAGMFLYQCFHR